MNIEHLYDRHAARLYAIALRLTGDESTAAAVLEEVFVAVAAGAADPTLGSLVRLTRDRSLIRQTRSASATVVNTDRPTPRQLVEAAFFGRKSLAELAAVYGLTETEVRTMLRDGMAELRSQFAVAGTK